MDFGHGLLAGSPPHQGFQSNAAEERSFFRAVPSPFGARPKVSDSQGAAAAVACPPLVPPGRVQVMWFPAARLLVFATGFSACLAMWPMGPVTSPSDDQTVVTTATNHSSEGFVVDDADEREEEEREDDRPLLVILDGGLATVESGCRPAGRDRRPAGRTLHGAGAPQAIRGPPRHLHRPGV